MSQRLAYWLGGFGLLALSFDLLVFGTPHMIFLGKHFFEILHWAAFWR